MELVSSWTGYWLAILSVTTPSLVPTLLVGRINFRLKVLWVGWCLYCSTGVPVWLQEVGFSSVVSHS